MAIPTTPTWNLADFSEDRFVRMLALSSSDLTITPQDARLFEHDSARGLVSAEEAQGQDGSLQFHTTIPERFTLDVVLRCPSLPHNLGDLTHRRFGFSVADDAGRGFSLYFAKTGVAISRVDDYGAATALPDTSDVTEAIAQSPFTLRVALDSRSGRAYVFLSPGHTETPALRWIVPVEKTPFNVGDLFKVFLRGTRTEPVRVEISRLRLASGLVIANYPPIADAGPDRVTSVGKAVKLDGRASYDLENFPLQYAWSCVDVPYGSQFAAEVSAASTVDDGDHDGVTPLIVLSADSMPEWLAPGDVVRIGGGTYYVASISRGENRIEVTSDALPDTIRGAPLRFVSQAILVDATRSTPVVLPDVAGVFRFRLTVNDGIADSEPAEVLVQVSALSSPAGVEPSVSAIWKAIGDEWRLFPGREIFEEAWIGISQILAGKLLEAWQYHYNSSIRDAQRFFQKKWVALRTLLAEPSPEGVTLLPRFGSLVAGHKFEAFAAELADTELVLEVHQREVARVVRVGFTAPALGGFSVEGVVADINGALAASGISDIWAEARAARDDGSLFNQQGGVAASDGATLLGVTWPWWVRPGDVLCYAGHRIAVRVNGPTGAPIFERALPIVRNPMAYVLYRRCRLVLTGRARVRATGTACAALELPEGAWNELAGAQGSIVTDRVYHVDGVDLVTAGVQRGDLFVTQRGQALTVDRVLDDPADPHPNARVLLFDTLPRDTSGVWAVPSVVRSADLDFDISAVYPGDTYEVELVDQVGAAAPVARCLVVGEKGQQLAAYFTTELHDALARGQTVRGLGVRRRKAIPLPDDFYSVPTLQEILPANQQPFLWREHIHYELERFHRDIGGAPYSVLLFRDGTFVSTDAVPPDVLWAETVLIDNEPNVESLFGRLVNFRRENAAAFGYDFSYISAVAGLLYAQQRGPSLFALSVGAQILLGQPFAEVEGYVEEIRPEHTSTRGRILVRDADGNAPTRSQTVRAYYYRKVPNDLSATSGLGLNPSTDAPWQVGELVPQFAPLGAGVRIEDVYSDPLWWRQYARGGLMYEVEKFHRFAVRFDLSVTDLSNVSLLSALLLRAQPTYTQAFLVGVTNRSADVDIEDAVAPSHCATPFETLYKGRLSPRYDDYRGDGITTSLYDDGETRFDALLDVPLDTIEMIATVEWPGGDDMSQWPFDLAHPVQPDGSGQWVSLASGGSLAAGTYRVRLPLKDGALLP